MHAESVAVNPQAKTNNRPPEWTDFARFCEREGLDVDETIRILKAHAADRKDS